MPVTTFSKDKVRAPKSKIDKELLLKMSSEGQIIRFIAMENPTYEWVHTLQKPILGVDGKPKMRKVEKRNGDTEYQNDMEFVGSPVCLGDPDIIEENGSDPDHCPVCELAKESAGQSARAPMRRFAVPGLHYVTQRGSANPAQPLQAQYKIWTLTENRFSEVVSILDEFGDVHPSQVDLILGPCESVQWQRYTIKAAQQCTRTINDEIRNFLDQIYENSKVEDVAAYCGFRQEKRFVLQDIEDIRTAWEEVRTGGREVTAPEVSTALDSSLLDTKPAAPQVPAQQQFVPTPADAPPGHGDPLNEFRPGGSAQDAPVVPQAEQPLSVQLPSEATAPQAPAPAAPAPNPPAQSTPAPSKAMDFTTLMASLTKK